MCWPAASASGSRPRARSSRTWKRFPAASRRWSLSRSILPSWRVNPAPFCILDEIEAALDDANVVRFAQYLRRVSDKTQFIVITHRRGTMEAANVLYGVTMQEDGVSKLLKLDLEQVDATLVS